MIRILKSSDAATLFKRRAARMQEAEQAVRPILDAVRTRGDKAVIEFARKFDQFQGSSFRIAPEKMKAAWGRVGPDFRKAVATASANIRAYAKLQLPKPGAVKPSAGVQLSQIVRPLDCVAAYIPSGRFPLPSTLMMTVIPAQIAGVPRICAASPHPVDAILGTASYLKAADVFQIGGAHAIAAFAYGTKTVPKADRIVGPGNIYVAAAKKLLAGDVGIDFVAGPTEILIIAAEGNPRWIACDMLAQAEHDTDASAILLTTSRDLARAVATHIEEELAGAKSGAVAATAIRRNSAIVIVETLEEAVHLSNQMAPEHLSIEDASLLPGIRHAGSVFVGPHSPEAAGDYASGPNHVLPTGGAARVRGGLSAADFVKVISVQQLSGSALRRLTPAITTLARAEGLEFHARSVEARRDA